MVHAWARAVIRAVIVIITPPILRRGRARACTFGTPPNRTILRSRVNRQRSGVREESTSQARPLRKRIRLVLAERGTNNGWHRADSRGQGGDVDAGERCRGSGRAVLIGGIGW